MAAVGVAGCGLRKFPGNAEFAALRQFLRPHQRLRQLFQPLRVLAGGPSRCLAHDLGAGLQRGLDVGRLDAALEIVLPGEEAVHPGGDRVEVTAELVDLELAAPVVVDQRLHFELGPLGLALVPIPEAAAQDVVAVREGIGFDQHLVADAALGREAAAVDLRGHILDDRALPGPAFGVCRSPRLRAAIPGRRAHAAALKQIIDSGGRVSDRECMRPCAGTGAASAPPMLPCPLPP